MIVIAELLGIPVDDRLIFRQWAQLLFSQNQQTLEIRLDDAALRALFEAVAPTMREMNAYLLAHIRQRRAHPTTTDQWAVGPRWTGSASTMRRSSGSSACS